MKVEKQCGKSIKVVRSDHGCEYYGKYDESGQNVGDFAKFLQRCGIVPRYAMPGTLEQNGVSKRRNQTLKDMVRSMMSKTNLPENLWVEPSKTVMYILNKFSSKTVSEAPFELWTDYKPSLAHFRVWGCPTEVRIYNPLGNKLDPKSTPGYFIGYPDRSNDISYIVLIVGSELLSPLLPNFWRMMLVIVGVLY